MRDCASILAGDQHSQTGSLEDLLTYDNSVLGVKSGLETTASEIEMKANQMSTDTQESIEIYMQ